VNNNACQRYGQADLATRAGAFLLTHLLASLRDAQSSPESKGQGSLDLWLQAAIPSEWDSLKVKPEACQLVARGFYPWKVSEVQSIPLECQHPGGMPAISCHERQQKYRPPDLAQI
jgi:hypothetical protein